MRIIILVKQKSINDGNSACANVSRYGEENNIPHARCIVYITMLSFFNYQALSLFEPCVFEKFRSLKIACSMINQNVTNNNVSNRFLLLYL